jgi:hypothetical protein
MNAPAKHCPGSEGAKDEKTPAEQQQLLKRDELRKTGRTTTCDFTAYK